MIFSRPKIAALIIFAASFIFLLLNNKYHVPSTIRIVGTYSKPIFLHYFWDSGSGYNKYEENNIWLGEYENFEFQSHLVEIGLISEHRVVPKIVRVNKIFIKGPEKGSNYKNILEEKVDIKNSTPLKMNLEFSEIMFSFKNEIADSNIFIKIDNQVYRANLPDKEMISIINIRKFVPGAATNVIPLPQLRLLGLKFQGFDPLSNFEIEDAIYISNNSSSELPLSKFKNLTKKIVIEKKYLKNTKFHLLFFSIQFFLALIIGWLFYESHLFIKKLNYKKWIYIPRKIFIENKRWIFWIVFIISLLSLLFWLLGQWPGDLNWDSFQIWRMAQNLNLDNKFSFVFVLIAAGLSQFYNSPAAVAIFQIVLMSGLLAWIFYFSYKNNASKKILVLLFILSVISIPIGMSTILVNTSTFFALLTAFWGFYLFRLGLYKKKGAQLKFSDKHLIILAFLFYLLLSIRYNALIYIIFLPVTIQFLKIFTKKTFLKFVVYSITIIAVFHFGVGSLLNIHKNTNYKFRNLSYKIPTLIYFFANENMFYSNDFDKDRKVLEKVADVDLLTKDFRIEDFGRFYAILEDKWMENEKEINQLFFTSVINNIPLYFAYRTHIFLATLGFTDFNETLYYLRGKSIEAIKISRPLAQRKLISKPVIPGLEELQTKILISSSSYSHILKPKFCIWNTGILLLILVIILIVYKWLPLSASVSFFVLVQVPFLFIMLPTIHWRYLYFIFLFGFLILFLVLTEIKSIRLKMNRN